MMTGVSAIMAGRGARLGMMVASGVLALMVVAAGGFAVWYRLAYNVWPGQQASARVHWCGRTTSLSAARRGPRPQITAQQHYPIRPVGPYPPLAWSRRELFAAGARDAQRSSVSSPTPCAMVVYLRTGPDEYQAYSLEGGP
jgi:hypothetical protein